MSTDPRTAELDYTPAQIVANEYEGYLHSDDRATMWGGRA